MTMGATAFLPVRNRQHPQCAHALSVNPPPAGTLSRHRGTIQARNRHETGTKRAWFGHGCSRPQHAHPPLPSALAPPENTLFSATPPICQTNPRRCALSSIFCPPSSPPPVPLAHAASSITSAVHH